MASFEDLWYAAKTTKLVYLPPKLLETFGETLVHYQVFSEDLDEPDVIHLRQGIVSAARPQIITPKYFMRQALENFSEDARQYFNDVLSEKDTSLFLQYGLCFRKQEFSMETISGKLEECAEQAAGDAQDAMTELRGVVIAADDTWEISLLHMITELVRRSVPYNAMDFQRRGLLTIDRGLPIGARQEIEQQFACCDTLSKAHELAAKLRDYDVFEEFEDRFYDLYRKVKT